MSGFLHVDSNVFLQTLKFLLLLVQISLLYVKFGSTTLYIGLESLFTMWLESNLSDIFILRPGKSHDGISNVSDISICSNSGSSNMLSDYQKVFN